MLEVPGCAHTGGVASMQLEIGHKHVRVFIGEVNFWVNDLVEATQEVLSTRCT